MIISHKHKFIFIKTAKTAGTSIEVDLNPLLGPKDVATPIIPPVAGHQPKNYSRNLFWFKRQSFRNHMSARDVRRLVGHRVFDAYYVFCVEREPVDKCISMYSMMKKSPTHNAGNEDLSWEDFVAKGDFPINTRTFTDANGNLLVNRILRYETLAEDLQSVAGQLGFEIDLKAQAKSGFREDIKVTAEQRETIYKAFAQSNQYTGYTL